MARVGMPQNGHLCNSGPPYGFAAPNVYDMVTGW